MINMLVINILLLILAIALLDYILFAWMIKCPHCKRKIAKWYSFIPPTLLELLMFIFGIRFALALLLK